MHKTKAENELSDVNSKLNNYMRRLSKQLKEVSKQHSLKMF